MTSYQEHLIYMKGWADGAGRRSMNPDLMVMEKDIYDHGYNVGHRAFQKESEGDAKVRKVNLHEIKAQ